MKAKFEVMSKDIVEKLKKSNSKLLYKLQAEATDYAKVLGIDLIKRINSSKEYGPYWLTLENYTPYAIISTGMTYQTSSDRYNIGTRPVISFSSIKHVCKMINSSVIEKCEMGEMPQSFASDELQEELETSYIKRELKETGRVFTRNISELYVNSKLEMYSMKEYEYKGKKYVRVTDIKKIDGIVLEKDIKLMEYMPSYWIEVEPITWLIDRENDIAISEKILLAGIPYDVRKLLSYQYKEVTSILELYLNGYFKYEIGEEGLIDEKETEYYRYIAFTDRLIRKLLKEKDKYIEHGVTNDIILILVELINENNITTGISKELLMSTIVNQIIRQKGKRWIDLDYFINHIKSCNSLTASSKKEAIDKINNLTPQDCYEDYECFTVYPAYRYVLANHNI